MTQPWIEPPAPPSEAPRSPTRTEYSLVVLMMGTLGIIAVPAPNNAQRPESRVSAQQVEREQQLARALEDWRSALQSYREQHACFPGYAPGREGGWLHGALSESDFWTQIRGWTDVWGNASPSALSALPHRPCLTNGVPVNPWNGLTSVRLVADGEQFGEHADGATGWVFKPATGELRANCAGAALGTGVRYWDL